MWPELVLVVTSIFFLGAGDTKEDTGKMEKAKLKGAWKLVAVEMNGKQSPPAEDKAKTMVFDGETLLVKHAGGEDKETYRIDPSKKPKTIEMTTTSRITTTFQGKTETRTEKVTLRGIYEFEGTKLRLCLGKGKEPPKDFITKDKVAIILILERTKP